MQDLLLMLLLCARVLSGCFGASYDDPRGGAEGALPEGHFSCDVVSARDGAPFHTCLESVLPDDEASAASLVATCNRHNRGSAGRGFSTTLACKTLEPGCSCRSKVLQDPETFSTEFHYRAEFEEFPEVFGPWEAGRARLQAQCKQRQGSEWVCFGGEQPPDPAESEWVSAR